MNGRDPAVLVDGENDEEDERAFQDALWNFKERCSKRHMVSFNSMTGLDVKGEIIRIQRDQERNQAMMNLRRTEKFILRLEALQEILSGFLDGSHYISYIWGSMHFLLTTASSTMTEGLDSLLTAYEDLGKKMPELRNLDALFIKHTRMRECLGALYGDLLNFHAGAYRCFNQFPSKGRKKIFKSAWKDFGCRITSLEANFRRHSTLVETGAEMLRYRHTRGLSGALSPENVETLMREVHRYMQEGIDREQEFKEKEKTRVDKQFKRVLKWMSAGKDPSEGEHLDKRASYAEHPGTCDWIGEVEQVVNWKNEVVPTHSILWINGPMGSGKSTLASYLIERCKESPPAGAAFKTVYFYCKSKDRDPESSTCLSVFRSLLHQQLLQIKDEEEYRHLIAYCHDKKDSAGQQHLNNGEVARPLLELFFDIIPRQYVIIDGLDECDKPEIKQTLDFLSSVVGRLDKIEPGRVRLLVASRDVPFVKKPLSREESTANIVKIEPASNEKAISIYVTQRLDNFRDDVFRLRKDDKERIHGMVCSPTRGARGMFLFAFLVLNNLEACTSREHLEEELGEQKFPGTLSEAYKCILQNLRDRREHRNDQHWDSTKRWEKTKAIFGWLMCAKRTLRWHEIQAIVSIERNDQSMEFERKKFTTEVQELCGTLVNVKENNRVELIHHTAEEYILESKLINKEEVEFDLATLCMEYLTFPCFEKGLDPPLRKSFATKGFFAFQDYAISKWFYHIAEVVRISPGLALDSSKSERFANVLDQFVQRYQDSISDQTHATNETAQTSTSSQSSDVEIEEKAKQECESLKNANFYEMLLNLWIHISKHEQKNISQRNMPSLDEMAKTLKENRETIEEIIKDETTTEKTNKSMKEYYGVNFFKCPRTHCGYFYEGFDTERKREHHINRHERPFECTVPGCGLAGAGFISNRDLEKHQKNYHSGLVEGPAAFPHVNHRPQNNEARFICNICQQRFTRKINLTGHRRSHFGERPFACQTCGRRFTRVNDLRRHERLHNRR